MTIFNTGSPIPADEREIEQDPHTSPISIPSGLDGDYPTTDQARGPVTDQLNEKPARKTRTPKEPASLTKKQIADLVASLAPEPEIPEHPAVQVRKDRIAAFKVLAHDLAQNLVDTFEAKETNDIPALGKALNSIANAAELAAKAIAAIPDGKVTTPTLNAGPAPVTGAVIKSGAELRAERNGDAPIVPLTRPKRPAKPTKPIEEATAVDADEDTATGDLPDEIDPSVLAAAEAEDQPTAEELAALNAEGF